MAASTDELTTLANRREFDFVIRREWQRALRERTSLSLLIIDADHFKLVNDQFGDSEGDRVLKGLAHIIRGTLKRPIWPRGKVAKNLRSCCPNTDGRGALKVAEAVRQAASIPAEHAQERAPGSYCERRRGFDCSRRNEASRPVIALADAALYRAKGDGRNGAERPT